MMHAKTMVVDGLFSMLGTSNLDSRSAVINEEVDITVYDADFGKNMEATFDADLKSARNYTSKDFKSRGLWERASEALVAPFILNSDSQYNPRFWDSWRRARERQFCQYRSMVRSAGAIVQDLVTMRAEAVLATKCNQCGPALSGPRRPR